jgi:hypothetical protein
MSQVSNKSLHRLICLNTKNANEHAKILNIYPVARNMGFKVVHFNNFIVLKIKMNYSLLKEPIPTVVRKLVEYQFWELWETGQIRFFSLYEKFNNFESRTIIL